MPVALAVKKSTSPDPIPAVEAAKGIQEAMKMISGTKDEESKNKPTMNQANPVTKSLM